MGNETEQVTSHDPRNMKARAKVVLFRLSLFVWMVVSIVGVVAIWKSPEPKPLLEFLIVVMWVLLGIVTAGFGAIGGTDMVRAHKTKTPPPNPMVGGD